MATLGNFGNDLSRRQDLLIRTNMHSLRQALRLLEQIDDKTYLESPPGFAPHRVGAHLRHVLEFYECFLDGIELSHIDYDARRRDEAVETSRRMAMARIRATIERLENTPELRGDYLIWIRMEDSKSEAGGDQYLTSSPGRELQVLASHTTHHFALIAMTLTAHGVSVDRDFGMAPSTRRHIASMTASATAQQAATEAA